MTGKEDVSGATRSVGRRRRAIAEGVDPGVVYAAASLHLEAALRDFESLRAELSYASMEKGA